MFALAPSDIMVVVKIFHGSEIKRFRFDNPAELTHENLHHLCRENFRSITEDHCFKYFDDEGDLCTLTKATFNDCCGKAFPSSEPSSARQGESAGESGKRSEVPDTVVRLFSCEKVAVPTCDMEEIMGLPEVRPGLQRPERTQVSRDTHPGITCDCCGTSPITGLRYKCDVCPDFDLCTACYDTPMSSQMMAHVGEHDFSQMSALDSVRERSRRLAQRTTLPFQTEVSMPPMPQRAEVETMTGQLSPRVGSEWTEVSVGAPHVEGLLRAFGVDVDSAKEAVKKFIATGNFQDIVEHLKHLKRDPQEQTQEPSTSRAATD